MEESTCKNCKEPIERLRPELQWYHTRTRTISCVRTVAEPIEEPVTPEPEPQPTA